MTHGGYLNRRVVSLAKLLGEQSRLEVPILIRAAKVRSLDFTDLTPSGGTNYAYLYMHAYVFTTIAWVSGALRDRAVVSVTRIVHI